MAAALAAAAARGRRVTAAGPGADLLTLATVQCRQVLIQMDEVGEGYWHHLLIHRVRDAEWITCDPCLTVQLVNLAREEVIPLGKGVRFPIPGRPFLTFVELNDGN